MSGTFAAIIIISPLPRLAVRPKPVRAIIRPTSVCVMLSIGGGNQQLDRSRDDFYTGRLMAGVFSVHLEIGAGHDLGTLRREGAHALHALNAAQTHAEH